jgi:hypothetical protein
LASTPLELAYILFQNVCNFTKLNLLGAHHDTF